MPELIMVLRRERGLGEAVGRAKAIAGATMRGLSLHDIGRGVTLPADEAVLHALDGRPPGVGRFVVRIEEGVARLAPPPAEGGRR